MSNANIDKVTGIELARHVLATAAAGPDSVVKNGQLVPMT